MANYPADAFSGSSKLGSRVKRENTSAKQKLYRPLRWQPTAQVFNFEVQGSTVDGGGNI